MQAVVLDDKKKPPYFITGLEHHGQVMYGTQQAFSHPRRSNAHTVSYAALAHLSLAPHSRDQGGDHPQEGCDQHFRDSCWGGNSSSEQLVA